MIRVSKVFQKQAFNGNLVALLPIDYPILTYPLMGTFANSKDPDEMSLNTSFHQDLHCLLRHNQSSEKEIQFLLEIISLLPVTPQHIQCTILNLLYVA